MLTWLLVLFGRKFDTNFGSGQIGPRSTGQKIMLVAQKLPLSWKYFTKFFFFYYYWFPGLMIPINILIRSNKKQKYAGIYLLQNHSTCFGCPSHPTSGVHKTVTAASGTGHSIWATTFLHSGQCPRWRKAVAQILWPVPEAAVTVLCTPDDGCDRHPKHVEWFCSK